MQIKASISLATAIYFIENSENIKEMEFELGDYPNYLSGEVLAWKVLDYKDDFLRENPHSMEIEDCFSEHISMIESQNKAHWSDPKWEGKAYVRPNIERSLDVIRDEAKTVVE
jgi:hypothetical protein